MKSLSTLPDKQLYQLLQESDHAAYTEIYNRYFSLLYIHASKKLQDEEQAKDVVQEVFTTLWFKRGIDNQIKNLAAYLFTATRNKIFDIFAHEKVKNNHLDSLTIFYEKSGPIPTDYRVREKEMQEYIQKEIDALPPKMRRVFEMNKIEELSYQEIASNLHTTENNVSKQVNNALKVLRTKLGILMILLTLATDGYSASSACDIGHQTQKLASF